MRVPVKGAELEVTTHGQGPLWLFPTGVGTPHYLMQTEVLSRHFTLVFVNLRGSGRSTGEAKDLSFDVLAEDLDAVRAALGAERVPIIGHSAMGIPVVEYARRRPDHVPQAVIVGTPPRGDMRALAAAAAAFFDAAASPERKQVILDNLARLPPGASQLETIVAQGPMRFFDARYDAGPLFAAVETTPAFLMHLLGTLTAGWEFRPPGPPLLIAHGRHDYTVPYTLWDGVAELCLFEKSGHQPFFEEPERFVEVLTVGPPGT